MIITPMARTRPNTAPSGPCGSTLANLPPSCTAPIQTKMATKASRKRVSGNCRTAQSLPGRRLTIGIMGSMGAPSEFHLDRGGGAKCIGHGRFDAGVTGQGHAHATVAADLRFAEEPQHGVRLFQGRVHVLI